MRRFKVFQFAVTGIAGIGLTLPTAAPAAEQTPAAIAQTVSSAPAVTDVALRAGGSLQGQVVDAQGVAIANATVGLQFEGRLVATAKTNSQGYFALRGLHGGTFQVSAAGGGGVYRLWAENSAPPLANSGVLVVGGQEAARGQNAAWGNGPKLLMLGVMGGIVTGGVITASTDHRSGS